MAMPDAEGAAWSKRSLPLSNAPGCATRSPRNTTHALSIQGMLLPFTVVHGLCNVQQRRCALAPG
eukprot:6199626-Pleurochrysis_carterae.AAC.1